MRLELSQTGGIANLLRKFILEDDSLKLLDRGEVKYERKLDHGESERVSQLLRELGGMRPKGSYGHTLVSDPTRANLVVKQDGEILNIEVLSDPEDPPPAAYKDLVRFLQQLTR